LTIDHSAALAQPLECSHGIDAKIVLRLNAARRVTCSSGANGEQRASQWSASDLITWLVALSLSTRLGVE
ncbi:MAG: hypothetical protein WAN23_01010, partial [Candidatus Acidiferrales bacterium]